MVEEEKVFEVIEVAKGSGKLKKGSNEVTKVLEKGKAKFVAIAKDVSPPEITMHIPVLAKEKGIPCFEVNAKEDLGAAAGMSVGTAAVAVVQEGDAKKLIAAFKDEVEASKKEKPAPEEKKEEPKEEKAEEKKEEKGEKPDAKKASEAPAKEKPEEKPEEKKEEAKAEEKPAEKAE